MNKNAATPQLFLVLILLLLGMSLMFNSHLINRGFLSITGFAPATSSTCGDVNESLTLTANIAGEFQCFNITAPNITFNCDHYTITGSNTANSIAIFINQSLNVTILNCTIKDYYYGIYANTSHNTTIIDNVFINETDAVYLDGSSENKIRNNNFTDTDFAIIGPISRYSNYAYIFNNTIRSALAAHGKVLLSSLPFANFTNNYVRIGYTLFSGTGPASSWQMTYNDFVTERALTSGDGSGASNVFIAHNKFLLNTSSSSLLIGLYNNPNWIILNNTLLGLNGADTYGIQVDRLATNMLVENNTITNVTYGILIYSNTQNATINRNTISYVKQGIHFGGAYNSRITNNLIHNATTYGINFLRGYYYPYESAWNNTVQNNEIFSANTTIYTLLNETNEILNSSYKVTFDYASVDFGSASFNFSYNISGNRRSTRFSERIAAVDSSKVPGLNKSANISYLVLTCDPVPEIRFRPSYDMSPSAFNDSDLNCTSLTTPSCTNVVCAGNYLNFTVTQFSSYATLPACVIPRNNDDIPSYVMFCSGSYNLSDGVNLVEPNSGIECNGTRLYGKTYSNAGIDVVNSDNVTIKNCFVSNFSYGTYSTNSNNVTFLNNTINNTGTSGLVFSGGRDGYIINNTFTNNRRSAIEFVNGAYYNFSNNNISNSGRITSFAIIFSQGITNNTYFENNIFFSNDANISIGAGNGWIWRNNLFENNSGKVRMNASNDVLFEGNTFINSSFESSRNNTIKNNIFRGGYIGLYGDNCTVFNNTISNTSFGIYEDTTGGQANISNNTIFNVTIGMLFNAGLSNVSGNYLENNILDFNSTTSQQTFFINQSFNYAQPNGTIFFGVSSFNFTKSTYDNIVILKNFVSVNSSNQGDINNLNKSANVSLRITSCPATLVKKSGFPKTREEIIDGGQNCTDCTMNGCSANILNFSTNSFSGIATSIPLIKSISPNASNLTQAVLYNDTNVSIVMNMSRINFSVNLTEPSSTTLTFTWFVNEVRQFVDTVSVVLGEIFQSVFSYVFPNTNQYNISVVINGSNPAENDTFTFNAQINDLIPPFFNETLSNFVVELGTAINFRVNATDNFAVDDYAINDTVRFVINKDTGLLQNNSYRYIGIYSLNITINDTTENNTNSSLLSITVQDTTKPEVSNISPTSAQAGVEINYNATVFDLDLAECRLYVDNVLNGNMTLNATESGTNYSNRSVILSTAGTYNLTANCSDHSGNYNDTSVTTITISAIPVEGHHGGEEPTTPPCVPSWSSTTSDCIRGIITTTASDGCGNTQITTTECPMCIDSCTAGRKECHTAKEVGRKPTIYVMSCDDYNGDGCVEWGYEKTCPDGCAAGICTLPTPPAEELPLPTETLLAEIPTSIVPSQINVNSFSCIKSNNIELSRSTVLAADESTFDSKIEKGYDVLLSAFSVACPNHEIDLSFTIPDNYEDVKALRCKGGNCNPVAMTEINTLSCGSKIFKNISRTVQYLEPESFPINVTKKQISGTNVLESSKNRIKFIGNVKGTVTLEAPTERVKEAENTGIKIAGTPVVLAFDQSNSQLSTQITLPYAAEESIDEFSISLYARKNERWQYLGGKVNMTSKTVTANVSNIMDYAENNKVLLAPMGVICSNCLKSELKQVYEGRSKDAVILVHGFENTPERFEDIINDIRLTNQPWQAWTFGYPSSKTIDESAKEFADLLEAKSAEFEHVYLASHSMGGLITQQMLRYAYETNQKIRTYTFLDKVEKVIIIAAPNKGTLSEGVYKDLFNYLLNSKTTQDLFNLNSAVVQELIQGRTIERVPGIKYYVIAGTRPFDFTKQTGISNDGLVGIESARTVGNIPVVNKCGDYWEINVTHIDILNNPESRKIVERIVAKEISEALPEEALLGYNQYVNLKISDCASDDKYIIIGKKIEEKAVPEPAKCGCGNGVCGLDETDISCPSDCAIIRKPGTSLLQFLLHFKAVQYLLGGLIVITLLIFLVGRRTRLQSKLIMPVSENKEKLLNNLLLQTRIKMRLGDHDRAAVLYNKFAQEYSTALLKTKEKFAVAAEKLKEEVRRKML